MKVFVVAAVVIIGLAQQPVKPPTGSLASKGNSSYAANPANPARKTDPSVSPATPARPATTAPANSDVPPARSPATDLNQSHGDSALQVKLTWFIEALAIVATLQFIFLIWQGNALRKMLGGVTTQAREMEYQSGVIDNQRQILAEQLTALKDTATAASATAIAAKESVELIVRKERARLRIELQPFYLHFGAPSPANYAVQLQGSTDAFVLKSQSAIYVSDSKEPEPGMGIGRPMPIPSVITAETPVVVAQDVLHPFTEEEFERIRQRKSFVHFTGFIRYKDVFDGVHETRFNRVWSVTTMNNLGGEPFTYWEHCGESDENLET